MQLISPGDSQKSWAFCEWSRVTARTREEQNETMTRLTLFNCCDKREVWMWLLSSIHLYSSNVWNMVTLPCHIISLIHEQIIWSHITYIHSIMDHDFADVPHKLIHEQLIWSHNTYIHLIYGPWLCLRATWANTWTCVRCSTSTNHARPLLTPTKTRTTLTVIDHESTTASNQDSKNR